MKGDDEPVDNRVAITGREYEAVVEDEAEQRRRLLPRGQETRLCSLQEYYLLTRKWHQDTLETLISTSLINVKSFSDCIILLSNTLNVLLIDIMFTFASTVKIS